MNARSLIPPIACVLAVTGVSLGFATIGNPSHNRAVSLDMGRIEAMQRIAEKIPRDGDAPNAEPTPLPYEDMDGYRHDVAYARTGKKTFRLCSTFEIPSTPHPNDEDGDGFPPHPAGYSCYRFRAGSMTPNGPVVARQNGAR